MSTGVDWLLHLITVLVGTVSGMSTGVDSFFHTHDQKRWVVSKMSTEVDQRVWFLFVETVKKMSTKSRL